MTPADILFKAKRKDKNLWVYGSHVIDANGNSKMLSPLSDDSGTEFWNDKFQFHDIDPSTLCMWTTLTDKNGKKKLHIICGMCVCDMQELLNTYRIGRAYKRRKLTNHE